MYSMSYFRILLKMPSVFRKVQTQLTEQFFFFPKELELLGLLYGLFQQFISFDQRLVEP